MAGRVTVSERLTYVLDGVNVKVRASEWDLMNGTIGTAADIAAEMRAVLRDTIQTKVFTALSTIWNGTNTPSNYVSVGGPVTASVLDDAIAAVTAVSGSVKAIVGIRSLMNPITHFGAFWTDQAASLTTEGVDSQKEKAMRDGVLGVYSGAPLIYLQQLWNNPEDHVAMLPTDKILVIGGNAGEFINYGDPIWKEYTDPRPTPSEWIWETAQMCGLIIDNAESIYVIDDVTA